MKTELRLDVSQLTARLVELRNGLDPKTFEKVLRYTLKETGNKVKTVSKPLIQKKYKAKSRRITQTFGRPYVTTTGGINCIVPLRGPRGTIANNGAYRAIRPMSRTGAGPGAKVLTSTNTILPFKKGSGRIHFYIPSGKLAGHVFVRHEDKRVWRGPRRENNKVVGMRKRVGSLSHGVSIGVPQMPLNRSANEIQKAILDYAGKRLEHHAMRALSGMIK